MKSAHIIWIYLVVALANAAGQLLPSIPELISFTKPLLMPLLIFYVYRSSQGNVSKGTLVLVLALIFSWGGDLALMSSDLFLLGVGSFFLAQCAYIVLFWTSAIGKIQFKLVPLIPYLIYTAFLLYYLIPNAGELVIPIVGYGLSLLTMTSIGRLRKGTTGHESYLQVAIGAVLFLVSDSLIAINKFVVNLPMGGLAIMVTYMAAQYLIVSGMLKHQQA